MKNKKFVFLFLMLITHSLALYADVNCECGEHATGITAYSTTGDDCCKGTPGTNGAFHTYTQQSNGVWQLTGTTIITGTSAQNTCCPPSDI